MWLIVLFRNSLQIDLLRKWIKIYRSRLISKEEGLVGKHVGENFEIGATELGYLFWGMHTHTLRLHFFRTLEQVLKYLKYYISYTRNHILLTQICPIHLIKHFETLFPPLYINYKIFILLNEIFLKRVIFAKKKIDCDK